MKADSKSINKIIIIIYLIGSVMISVYTLIAGRGRFVLTLLSPLFLLIPIVLEKIFKLKRNYSINNMLYLFSFFSFGLGTSAAVYSILPGYDKVCHFFSGILFTLIGAYIYELLTADKHGNNNAALSVKELSVKELSVKELSIKELSVYLCFSAFFSFSCAYVWEIYEYIYSLITGEDIQWVNATGIGDTMQDMITALFGTIIVTVYFIYRNIKRKSNNHTGRR